VSDENRTYEWAYRTLARRLDALPNGFPATEEGAELRLLAKIFTPEEAVLAAAMTETPETYEAIAMRAGVDAKAAHGTLKQMVRQGLIRMQRGDGGVGGTRALLFSLMPFVVGFYEAQLPRMDAEMAALFETYFHATRGLNVPGPSVHRVLPVGEAVQGEIEIHPFEQATALIEGARSWGVRDCICRKQQQLLDKGCDAPVENCLVFAPIEGVFAGGIDRAISKDEALRILREAADAGLVHSVGNHREGHNYICNCCTCCCGVLRRVAEFAVPTAIARSAFRAVVDEASCIGCGACVDRCQFGALALTDSVAVVESLRCVGCGQCTLVCPTGAISIARLPEAEVEALPADEAAWAAARLAERAAGDPAG
jgi:Na+-translocating ferredoxin:NAD+ oxidoreductase subunit B